MAEFKLPSGDGRTTEFTGVQLAHQSSRREDSQLRWTEISIYRTEGGNYIVHKVGRSVVFHEEGRPCSSGEEMSARTLDPEAQACPKCGVPSLTSAMNAKHPLGPPNWTKRMVRREQDRNTVHVSTSAEGAVESCHTEDDEGAVYLTNAARLALQEASRRDFDVADAFTVQRVD